VPDDRAELDVEVEVVLFALDLSGSTPASEDFTKLVPSKTSPRIVTRSTPSLARSALSETLSPSTH